MSADQCGDESGTNKPHLVDDVGAADARADQGEVKHGRGTRPLVAVVVLKHGRWVAVRGWASRKDDVATGVPGARVVGLLIRDVGINVVGVRALVLRAGERREERRAQTRQPERRRQ